MVQNIDGGRVMGRWIEGGRARFGMVLEGRRTMVW
jgi:hypothetical protein